MAVQSFLAFPVPGAGPALHARLGRIRGCDAVLERDGRLILLVVDPDDADHEREIRAELHRIPEIQCLVLVFGEIEPDTTVADPIAALRRERPPRTEGIALPTLSAGADR